MLRGLYTAATGLAAVNFRNEIESNNMSNSRSNGYKKQEVVFESFREYMVNRISYDDPLHNPTARVGKIGSGVTVSEVVTYFDLQGDMVNTRNNLDFALNGEGYFVIVTPDGEEVYTRNGAFSLNPEGYLTSGQGHLVAGEDGPILIDGVNVSVIENGNVYVDDRLMGTIKVVSLIDPIKRGHNEFDGIVGPRDPETTVNQEFLELSNNDTVETMTKYLKNLRAYEMNQKLVQTFDATLDKAINDMGRV